MNIIYQRLFIAGMILVLGLPLLAEEAGVAAIREALRPWEQAGRYRWETTAETTMPAPLRLSYAVLLRGYSEIGGPTRATLIHSGGSIFGVFASGRAAVDWGEGWKAPPAAPRIGTALPDLLPEPPDPRAFLAAHWAALPAPEPLDVIRRLLELVPVQNAPAPGTQFVGELDTVSATACLGFGALGLFDLSSDPTGGLLRAAERGRITWTVKDGRLDTVLIELEGVSPRGPDGRPAHPALVATKRVSLRLLEADHDPKNLPEEAKAILGI